MKHIIMLSGRARSGKDTFALMLKQLEPSVKIVAFASPIKQILSATFDIPVQVLDEYKNEGFVCLHGVPQADQTNEEFQAQTYRSILQNLGQSCKAVIAPTIWIDKTISTIDDYLRFTEIVVVSDLRFPEELTVLKEHYGDEVMIHTLRIHKDGLEADTHISEDVLGITYDLEFDNNSGLEELKEIAQLVLKGLDE